MTIADRYPVPHIQDFSSQLSGVTMFSNIDLVHGYHQIPVATDDISKTAVITPFGLFEFYEHRSVSKTQRKHFSASWTLSVADSNSFLSN